MSYSNFLKWDNKDLFKLIISYLFNNTSHSEAANEEVKKDSSHVVCHFNLSSTYSASCDENSTLNPNGFFQAIQVETLEIL